jgi:hypothetical protein
VLVHRIAGGLHHKHIHAAHVLKELEVHFAVGKALNLGFAHRNPDVAADLLGQRAVGGAAEELEALVLAQVAGPLALGGGLASLALAASCWLSLSGSLPAPSRGCSGPLSGGCLSSAVTVNVPLPFPTTSKLVGFGCFPSELH